MPYSNHSGLNVAANMGVRMTAVKVKIGKISQLDSGNFVN